MLVNVSIMFVDICASVPVMIWFDGNGGGRTGLGARVVLHGLQGCLRRAGVRPLEHRPEADGVEPERVPRRAVSGRQLLDQRIDLAQDRGVVDVASR